MNRCFPDAETFTLPNGLSPPLDSLAALVDYCQALPEEDPLELLGFLPDAEDTLHQHQMKGLLDYTALTLEQPVSSKDQLAAQVDRILGLLPSSTPSPSFKDMNNTLGRMALLESEYYEAQLSMMRTHLETLREKLRLGLALSS